MLIGIIGAGLAGLTAGHKLVKAGHDVIVFEKSRGFGGRLATRYAGENHEIKFDHGIPHLSADRPLFRGFIQELEEKGIVEYWTDSFNYWDGQMIHTKHPNIIGKKYYKATDGMNQVGRYLSRWLEVRTNEKVIGFTYLGNKRRNKKPWMLNFEDSSTVEVDAVIVATPAVQAYGLIENAQDETVVRNVIRRIDTISYENAYSVMLTYNKAETPEWNGITCKDEPIRWIGNENKKRDNGEKLTLVLHSESNYAVKNINTPHEDVIQELAGSLRKIVGDWAGRFDEAQAHYWRYVQPRTFFEESFVITGPEDAPLMLTGDYLGGKGTESAYESGYKLAEKLIENRK